MSNHHVSNKALNIEPFHVVSLITRAMELEKQGKKIVNLVVGEPEFKTPKPIIDSAIKSLEQNKIRYVLLLESRTEKVSPNGIKIGKKSIFLTTK